MWTTRMRWPGIVYFKGTGGPVATASCYVGLRPVAQIQFFPDTCRVATSVNPA